MPCFHLAAVLADTCFWPQMQLHMTLGGWEEECTLLVLEKRSGVTPSLHQIKNTFNLRIATWLSRSARRIFVFFRCNISHFDPFRNQAQLIFIGSFRQKETGGIFSLNSNKIRPIITIKAHCLPSIYHKTLTADDTASLHQNMINCFRNAKKSERDLALL